MIEILTSKNHVVSLKENESKYLNSICSRLKNTYFNYASNVEITPTLLLDLYYENEEAIKNCLTNGVFSQLSEENVESFKKRFKEETKMDISSFYSLPINGVYNYLQKDDAINNIIAYTFLNPGVYRYFILKKLLKDKTILRPIKNVIKDEKLLAKIYPNGYQTVSLYDFINRFGFMHNEEPLKNIKGIGDVSINKIKKYLQDAGFPLIYGSEAYIYKKQFNNGLVQLLLTTSEDIKKLGQNLSFLHNTKYINNVIKLEKTTTDIKQPENEQPKQKEVTQLKDRQEKMPKPTSKDKLVNIVKDMPVTVIKKMIKDIFNQDLNLLLDMAKQSPELLIDYADCIPFNKFERLNNFKQLFTMISIQPKILRKLDNKTLVILMKNFPNKIKGYINSEKLTKAESISLNSYVNKAVDEYLASKKGITKK